MSLVSAEFLIFILISAGGYYLIPKRGQWIWLLAFSYLYYLSSGVGVVFFLLSGTLTTYVAGCSLEMLERSVGDTEIEKGTKKRKKKRVLILTLVFNFGILGILKYAGFFAENIPAAAVCPADIPTKCLPDPAFFHINTGFFSDNTRPRHSPVPNRYPRFLPVLRYAHQHQSPSPCR